MASKMPPLDVELLQRVDEVLHYIWDPIHVNGVPEARDEYTSYAHRVLSLLKSRATADEITKYLGYVVTERMELSGNLEHDHEISEILINWLNVLEEKYITQAKSKID